MSQAWHCAGCAESFALNVDGKSRVRPLSWSGDGAEVTRDGDATFPPAACAAWAVALRERGRREGDADLHDEFAHFLGHCAAHGGAKAYY